MNVAIMTTCYNRKDLTLRCLSQLHEQIAQLQASGDDTVFRFYICDDHSTDGTVDAIHDLYPDVRVIVSEGDLYWSRGMYVAMQAAQEDQPDLYLMINDDVSFYDRAVEAILRNVRYHLQKEEAFGVVGNTINPVNHSVNYGGREADGKIVPAGNMDMTCVLTNWNCFAATRPVIDSVGVIDRRYEHSYGDYDYSFMMQRKGLPIYVMDQNIGECGSNENIENKKSLSRWKRIRYITSKKGLPFKSYLHYHMKNYGWKGLPVYLYGYLSVLGYILMNKDIGKS